MQVPIFRPTLQEFSNFSKYIEDIESLGAHRFGMAKIIAPAEYVPRKIGYDLDSLKLKIPKPLEQVVSGENGIYQLTARVKRWVTVQTYHKWATSERYQTPKHDDYDHLERIYWENITGIAPIYGNDIDATLTDSDVTVWNCNNLNTILNHIRDDHNLDIRGVITSFIYFGMWKASFVWHIEDMDLYALNYIHFGAPKTWYAIPPAHGRAFEALANRLFPDESESCNTHLRHKRTIISPDVLRKNQIPFVKTTQEAGEFIIVFPYAYHAGFNHGFNAAESVNFASKRWIDYGKWTRSCDCTSRVDFKMDIFVERYQPSVYSQWQNGIKIGCHPEQNNEVVESAVCLKQEPKKSSRIASICSRKTETNVPSTSNNVSPKVLTRSSHENSAQSYNEAVGSAVGLKQEPKKSSRTASICSRKTETNVPSTSNNVSNKMKIDKACPICHRSFNRATHMRQHLKTHDQERDKVICSVAKCGKKYTNIKAWIVHFHNNHQQQLERFSFYKSKLGSETVANPTNVVNLTLVKKLMLDNAKLKNQISKILKINRAARLRKRSLKQIRKSSKQCVNDENVVE